MSSPEMSFTRSLVHLTKRKWKMGEDLEREARNGPFIEFMVRAANDYYGREGASLEGFEAHLNKLIDWNRSRMPKLMIEAWHLALQAKYP
jgi:hypothetical protein